VIGRWLAVDALIVDRRLAMLDGLYGVPRGGRWSKWTKERPVVELGDGGDSG